MTKAPKMIYLQINPEFAGLEGVTWCVDRINKTDIEYAIVEPKQESGMKKGYKYLRSRCKHCGDMIADNWYIRHLKEHHPHVLSIPKE